MQFVSKLVILVETSSLRFDEVGNYSNVIEDRLTNRFVYISPL